MYYLLSFVIPNPYAIIVLWKRDFFKESSTQQQTKTKLKLHATFIGVQAIKAFKHISIKDIKFYLANK